MKKFILNIKGSAIVEKIFMAVVSVVIAIAVTTFIINVINDAFWTTPTNEMVYEKYGRNSGKYKGFQSYAEFTDDGKIYLYSLDGSYIAYVFDMNDNTRTTYNKNGNVTSTATIENVKMTSSSLSYTIVFQNGKTQGGSFSFDKCVTKEGGCN